MEHSWIENNCLGLEHNPSQIQHLCIADMRAFQASTGNLVSCLYSVCRSRVLLPHLIILLYCEQLETIQKSMRFTFVRCHSRVGSSLTMKPVPVGALGHGGLGPKAHLATCKQHVTLAGRLNLLHAIDYVFIIGERERLD